MFWENYIMLCKGVNKSPNKVANEIGCSSGSVTAWKNGRIPKWGTLSKIAEYFGVTPDSLIGQQLNFNPPKINEETDTKSLDEQLEGVDFALYGETKDLSDAQKQDVLKFIKFLKSKDEG